MTERLDHCPECDQERILLPVENQRKSHYCWTCTECGLVVDTEEILPRYIGELMRALRKMKSVMTPEMEAFIRANRGKMSTDDMGLKLGVSGSMVHSHMQKWGIAHTREEGIRIRTEKAKGRSRKYTPDMDAYIREHYLTTPIKAIAEVIGGDWQGIMRRLRFMGLAIPAHIIEERKQMGRLKPGNVPMNKGRKQSEYMSHEMIARTAKTRFYKGHEPHNTREEYALSLRSEGYIWFRRGKNKWELLHRFIYRVHHDVKLTSEDNIVFRDHNRNNLHPSNLECISHDQLLERNTIHRYPQEVKATLNTLARLKRLIKQKENEKQD